MAWQESNADSILTACGLRPDTQSHRYVNYLLVVPLSDYYLHLERTSDGTDFGYQLGRSTIYVDIDELREWKGDLFLFIAIVAATQRVELAAFLELIRKISANVRLMTPDAAELLRVMAAIAQRDGGSAISYNAVREAYEEATVDVETLLDELEAKAIISRDAEGIKLHN